MKRIGRFLLWTTAVLLLLGAAGYWVYLRPILSTDVDAVFDMPQRGKLAEPALRRWNLFKRVWDARIQAGYDNPDYPWSRDQQEAWKFAIAFGAYALPSLPIIDPSLHGEAVHYLRNMIHAMKDKPVWDDWTRYAMGDDPVAKDNIMYKGHLNLMYGLYRLMSGDPLFDEEFHRLTGIIVRELGDNWETDGYRGIVCEPDQYFVQCNTVGLLSLRFYDAVFGTAHDRDQGYPLVDYIRERLSDPETGLVYRRYHPSHDYGEPYLTNFANAWALSFLRPYDRDYFDGVYRHWREGFIRDVLGGTAAYVVDSRTSDTLISYGEAQLGLMFVLPVSKEYDDRDTWRKYARFLNFALGPKPDGDAITYTSLGKDLEVILQGYVLWGYVHVGWDAILAHPWPAATETARGGVR